MKTHLKCSNCGAEINTLNLAWGRKQLALTLLICLPVVLLAFVPLLLLRSGEVTEDLVVTNVQTRAAGSSLEIIGLITNTSRHKWTNLSVEAEFFDEAGNFIDEADEYLGSDIAGHAEEHFKIEILSPSEAVLSAKMKPVVKMSGGFRERF